MRLCSLSGKVKSCDFTKDCLDKNVFFEIFKFPLILLITSNIADLNLFT